MKKITFKITAFLIFILSAVQVQAQAFATGTTGVYKIKVQGETLYLTQSTTTDALTYEQEVSGSDTQLFVINNHPDGDNYSITSKIDGKGAVEVLNTASATGGIGAKGNVAGGSGQQDKWNPTRGTGTQIFLESDKTGTGWEALGAKRRIQDFAEGNGVAIAGGTPVKFDFILVEALMATEEFDSASVIVANPVDDQLIINGLPATVKQISVYSLLGSEILTKKVEGQVSFSTDVSTLPSGVYVVEMIGVSGKHTVKVIKQ